MSKLQIQSAAQQVAAHLRDQLLRGVWTVTIPGGARLSRELGVGRMTVEAALSQLESEGLLVSQGPQRRRKIILPENYAPPALRVAMLFFDRMNHGRRHVIEIMNLLEAAGHAPFHADKTLDELGCDIGRVARYVKRTEADAWIIGAGSSEVLEWFVQQELPTFALFGRMSGQPLAGVKPDKAPSMAEIVRHLVALGHQRISLIVRREHRQPMPSRFVRVYLDEFEAAGIKTGVFNLPSWEESPKGFRRVIDSLFNGPSPPTALLLDEAYQFHAGYHHLSQKGLKIPQDVSLICLDDDLSFTWCDPQVSHVRWDHRPLTRRVVRWVNNLAKGKADSRQTLTKAEFVRGGTIGPAPGRK